MFIHDPMDGNEASLPRQSQPFYKCIYNDSAQVHIF